MIDPQTIKGFLTPEEGAALTALARAAAPRGAIVEIGAYCGRSALYLGAGAREAGGVVFSVDHHRGSEEHQPGGGYDDPALWDAELGRVDTLSAFRRAIALAELEDVVVAMVGPSATIARAWASPIALLFIDGGHALKTALDDWRLWGRHVALGGVLAVHDVFPDPTEGGRPPHEVYVRARASGLFEPAGRTGSLFWLNRID